MTITPENGSVVTPRASAQEQSTPRLSPTITNTPRSYPISSTPQRAAMTESQRSNIRSTTKRRSASPEQQPKTVRRGTMNRRMAIATDKVPNNSWADDLPTSSTDNSAIGLTQPQQPTQLPPWGQQLMGNINWMRRTVEDQEQRIREQKKELENMRALISENEELRTALESAKARIAELEKVAHPASQPPTTKAHCQED
ncbi:hypothetical protein BJV82DRAFT_681575 [Fennellomyces sp. T-0311]|nr:hypothetical protein BJV82DRAFT_681575 [Fennellomyces sp. T-0311]